MYTNHADQFAYICLAVFTYCLREFFFFFTISWKDRCSLTVLIIIYLDGNTFALIDNILSSDVDSGLILNSVYLFRCSGFCFLLPITDN